MTLPRSALRQCNDRCERVAARKGRENGAAGQTRIEFNDPVLTVRIANRLKIDRKLEAAFIHAVAQPPRLRYGDARRQFRRNSLPAICNCQKFFVDERQENIGLFQTFYQEFQVLRRIRKRCKVERVAKRPPERLRLRARVETDDLMSQCTQMLQDGHRCGGPCSADHDSHVGSPFTARRGGENRKKLIPLKCSKSKAANPSREKTVWEGKFETLTSARKTKSSRGGTCDSPSPTNRDAQ